MSRTTPATRPPHDLGLVIEFVNTLEPEAGTDSIATPEQLRSWLIEHRLLDRAEPPLKGAHQARAIALREALRALMLANNGGPHDARAAGEIEQEAQRGELRVRFAPDGSASLASNATGFDGALARLLGRVALASLDGTWRRVKACREPGCREAFYDHSRNRSGVWCDMALCGNRAKVRSYRARSRGKTMPVHTARAARSHKGD